MISHKAQPNDHSASNQNLIPCPSQCKAKRLPLLMCPPLPALIPSVSLYFSSLFDRATLFSRSYSSALPLINPILCPHLKSVHLSTSPPSSLNLSVFMPSWIQCELSLWLAQHKLNWFTRAEHSLQTQKAEDILRHFRHFNKHNPQVLSRIFVNSICALWEQDTNTKAWTPACKFLEYPGVLQTVVSTVALNVFFMILPLTYSLCSSRTCICFCEKDKDSLPVLSLHIKAKIIYQLQGDKGWWEQWWVSWTLPVVSAVSKRVYCQCFVCRLCFWQLLFSSLILSKAALRGENDIRRALEG